MLYISNTDSFSFSNIKQRLVKVLRFGRNDVQTPIQAAPPFIDAGPLKNMAAVYGATADKGTPVIIGYLNKDQIADVGELRLTCFDSNGAEQNYVFLRNTGNIEIGGDNDNMVRYSKLEQAFNDLKQDFNNLVTTFNAHTHTSAAPGSPTTTPSSAATPSTADIAPAKINNVLTSAT